jgi:hypothetical protein
MVRALNINLQDKELYSYAQKYFYIGLTPTWVLRITFGIENRV